MEPNISFTNILNSLGLIKNNFYNLLKDTVSEKLAPAASGQDRLSKSRVKINKLTQEAAQNTISILNSLAKDDIANLTENFSKVKRQAANVPGVEAAQKSATKALAFLTLDASKPTHYILKSIFSKNVTDLTDNDAAFLFNFIFTCSSLQRLGQFTSDYLDDTLQCDKNTTSLKNHGLVVQYFDADTPMILCSADFSQSSTSILLFYAKVLRICKAITTIKNLDQRNQFIEEKLTDLFSQYKNHPKIEALIDIARASIGLAESICHRLIDNKDRIQHLSSLHALLQKHQIYFKQFEEFDHCMTLYNGLQAFAPNESPKYHAFLSEKGSNSNAQVSIRRSKSTAKASFAQHDGINPILARSIATVKVGRFNAFSQSRTAMLFAEQNGSIYAYSVNLYNEWMKHSKKSCPLHKELLEQDAATFLTPEHFPQFTANIISRLHFFKASEVSAKFFLDPMRKKLASLIKSTQKLTLESEQINTKALSDTVTIEPMAQKKAPTPIKTSPIIYDDRVLQWRFEDVTQLSDKYIHIRKNKQLCEQIRREHTHDIAVDLYLEQYGQKYTYVDKKGTSIPCLALIGEIESQGKTQRVIFEYGFTKEGGRCFHRVARSLPDDEVIAKMAYNKSYSNDFPFLNDSSDMASGLESSIKIEDEERVIMEQDDKIIIVDNKNKITTTLFI